MKMKLFIIISLFMFISCRSKKCENPIYIRISSLDPGESIKVEIDDKVFEFQESFPNGYIMSENDIKYIKKLYCSKNAGVKISVLINNFSDSTIYINPTKIKGLFVGSNGNGQPAFLYDSLPPGKPFAFE